VAKAPVSEEELQLRKRARRRLIGAIVLVLLVVVLVPMFLEREPRMQKQDMDIRIPPIPGQTQAPSLSGATQPPAPPAAAEKPEPPSQPPSTPPPAAPAPEPPSQPATDAHSSTDAAKSEPATKTQSATPSKESAASDSYVVQAGAFSSAANAKQLLHKIKAERFPAYTELTKNAQGEKTRVRVGPYASLEAAEKARDRLKALKLVFGNDARVVRDGE